MEKGGGGGAQGGTAAMPLVTSAGTKPLTGLWVYVKRGQGPSEDGEKIKYFWECNFCGGKFNTHNASRLQIHLACEGIGIVHCKKVKRESLILFLIIDGNPLPPLINYFCCFNFTLKGST